LKIIDFKVEMIDLKRGGWEEREAREEGIPPSLPTGPGPE